MFEIVFGLAALVFVVFIYLLPTYVASRRQHKNLIPIFIINLFLGATGIAWVISLAWAFSSNVREDILT